MRKAIPTFVLCAIFCAPMLHAQGVAYSGSPVINGEGQPLAGVSVAISTTNPCGTSPAYTNCGGLPAGTYTGTTPPASLATLYTDISAGTTIANPLTTDPFGNWTAYFATGGTYWATVYSPYVVSQVSVFSVGIGSGLACLLTGGSGCVMTGAIWFPDANASVSAGSLEGDLWLNAEFSVTAQTPNFYFPYAVSLGGTVYDGSAAGGNPGQLLSSTGGGAPKTKWVTPTLRCETGLGDGLNAIAGGTYLQTFCYNDSGSTWTITGIMCFTDNSGSSTLAATDNSANALLTGPITCASTFVGGTQSTHVTIPAGGWVKFSFAADGTSTQTTWVVSMTQP